MRISIDFEDSTSTTYMNVRKVEMTEDDFELRLSSGEIVNHPKKDVAAMYTFNNIEQKERMLRGDF